MPGYDQYQKMAREIPGSVKLGSIAAQWKEDGSSFEYAWDGKRYRYDIATKQAAAIGERRAGAGRRGRRARARRTGRRGRRAAGSSIPRSRPTRS